MQHHQRVCSCSRNSTCSPIVVQVHHTRPEVLKRGRRRHGPLHGTLVAAAASEGALEPATQGPPAAAISAPPRGGGEQGGGQGGGGEEGLTAEQALAATLGRMSRRAQTPAGAVVCRLMQEADTQAATVILTRAFAGTSEEVGFTDATRYFDKVKQNLPRGALFVARLFPNDPALLPPNQDSRLIGTAALAFHEDTRQEIPTLQPPAEAAYLSNMAVDAKFRRLGVARALLELCDEAAAAAGKAEVALHVRQGDTPACTLYLQNGYAEVARDNAIGARWEAVP